MTQDEIIEMAVAAGITPWTKHEYIGNNNFSASDEGMDGDLASLIQFAQLVAAKEREEFAVHAVDIARRAVAEEREACIELIKSYGPTLVNGFMLTEAIRARGEA